MLLRLLQWKGFGGRCYRNGAENQEVKELCKKKKFPLLLDRLTEATKNQNNASGFRVTEI